LPDTDRCANIAVSKHILRFLATLKTNTISPSIDARRESTPMAVAEQKPAPAVVEPVATVELRHPRMLIDGAWVDSMSGRLLSVENPAKRCPIAEVPRGDTADVNGAVEAAARAFSAWSKVAPRERGRMLLRIAEVLETRSEELARTVALETGNALRTQARPEVRLTADIFRYFGGLAGELKGETIPLGEQVLSYTRREAIGVVGAIIPWNAPVLLGALKIAPAICAGNTIVLKAAEDAPLGVLLMAEICQEFLPRGVLNVLTGLGEECGGPLAEHPLVRKLSFTGSTEVGKIIMRAAAERIVPVSLELGGKSPSIVYRDANEDWVVDGVIAAMRFTRQSQSCTAGSRLFLHADIFDSFLDKLRHRTALLKLGDPLDEATDIGSIINEKQFRKVCAYIEEGLQRKEAQRIFGGLPPKEGPLSEGYFAIPTVFADASNNWRLAREEIFGPVLVARGARRPTRSVWPMTAIMVSLLMSGPMTSAVHCVWRTRSSRVGCR
jgi:acyl-CoA reductase-like NAD-dependent aldehyde dehydrogenase